MLVYNKLNNGNNFYYISISISIFYNIIRIEKELEKGMDRIEYNNK